MFVVAGLVAVGAIVLIWALVRDDGSSAEAVDAGDLVGTSWQIVEGTGPWGRVVSEEFYFERRLPSDYLQPGDLLIVPSALRVRFGDSELEGVEGCRDFAMSTTIEGTSIEFGGPATDETLCTDPALRTQPFLDTITAATTITTTEGLLQLDGPGGEIRFEQIETVGELREPEPAA